MTGGSRHGRKLRHAASVSAALGVVLGAACYSTGDGTPPPPNRFYYPVGLAVSGGGNVLYAVNSDFDLQFNGGTVQSYDLTAIRNDTVALLLGIYTNGNHDAGALTGSVLADAGGADAGGPGDDAGDAGAATGEGIDAGVSAPPGLLPFEAGVPSDAGCPNTNQASGPTDPNDPNGWNNAPGRLPIGQACSPPMDSTSYQRDWAKIGAFATDIQLSKNQARLFVPVRGDATITWFDLRPDTDPAYAGGPPPGITPAIPSTIGEYPPFILGCRRIAGNQCDTTYHAGQLTDVGNTRQLMMPGEPFAMAQSDDGTAIALTHQAENQTSLYLTGFVPGRGNIASPSIQFVVPDLPLGGDGIVAIPHDPAALTNPDPLNPLRPAFLQTSNQQPEIDLLRYYTDEGYQQTASADGGLADAGVAVQIGSSNLRPFLIKERSYPVTVNANGSNSRGIAIDPTPRLACESNAIAQGFALTSPEYVACAQTPARVFIASRSPPSLILGQVGGMSAEGTDYDPDLLAIYGNVPLAAGPSNIYVAPIVDANGRYSVRVFVVCFDSQTIAIYDPDAQRVENVVTTGPGPFAMAFDPFDLQQVADHAPVPADPRSKHTNIRNGVVVGPALRRYRFAYVTSFTNSFVQVMDLDQSFQDDRLGVGQSTFENIVYTLGLPTLPVGSNQQSLH